MLNVRARATATRLLLFCGFCVAGRADARSSVAFGGGGPIGDGKLTREATFKSPNDVAVDATGNLFIADTLDQRIRRVDAAPGIVTTLAGGGTSDAGDGGPTTEAELKNRFGELGLDSMSGARIA